METKHTKGEWIVVRSVSMPQMVDSVRVKEWGNNDLMGDLRGYVIADFTESHGFRKHAFAEAEANAKLIAAAPDLLEALQELYDFTNNYFGGSPAGKFARNTAFKAIKKATE